MSDDNDIRPSRLDTPELGWEAGRTARAWAELMSRLGYTHHVVQGGDLGAAVTDATEMRAAFLPLQKS